ncbi:MAG: zeta toxin family protein [Gammaproteobacteria bacterium]
MPHVIIIAGPNGAGKTTAAPALLDQALHISHFVNADTIAAGLSAFAPEKVAIQAGRAMLARMHYLAKENENFAFETTLASRSFAPWIVELKKQGYLFHLTFLRLASPDLAVLRVSERVKMGGHFVPEETVRRRYHTGLKNFFQLYAPIADSWQMYDNTDIESFTEIASKMNNQLDIQHPAIWDKLVEVYDEAPKK